ncbi:unnamed protein product [Strongylus vulgaris]|uniref:Uncharacterized protein n=1 Tax=Strongylus vulgaris TaxID=40348 RepID=A0A3P7I8V5_STRVU|nr:unnamed protein product [Strongylus vulgaris]
MHHAEVPLLAVQVNLQSFYATESQWRGAESDILLRVVAVPKYDEISSYWVFDILAGNSAFAILKDKNVSVARYFCRVIEYDMYLAPISREKSGSIPADDAAFTRERGDSLNEVLLLLETGTMPSQYIETSPPHPPPMRKGRTTTRRQGLRELKDAEIWDSSAYQESEVRVISPKSRPEPVTQLELPNVPRSESSGLSDSPDRLVICEDEDIVVHDDSIKIVENTGEPSAKLFEVTPSNLTSFVRADSTPEKVAEVVIREPLKRPTRKRSVHAANAVPARKRSVKEQARYQHITPSEPSREVEQSEKLQKKVPKPEPKSASLNPKATRRKKSIPDGKVLPEKDLAVLKETIGTPVSQARASLEGPVSVREKQMQRSGTQLSIPALVPSISRSSPPETAAGNLSGTTKKRRTSSSVAQKNSCVKTAAVFIAVPSVALAEIALPIKLLEAICLACTVPPTKDARRTELFTDTGLDILAEVAVSAASPLNVENLRARKSETKSSATPKRGRRKRSFTPEIIPIEAEAAVEEEIVVVDDFLTSKETNLSGEVGTPTETVSLETEPSRAGAKEHGERKRKMGKISELEIAVEPAKQRRTSLPTTAENNVPSAKRAGTKTLAPRARAKRRATSILESLISTDVVEDSVPSSKGIIIESEILPRASRRRRTVEPTTSHLAVSQMELVSETTSTAKRRRMVAAEKPSTSTGYKDDVAIPLLTSLRKRSTRLSIANSAPSTSRPQSVLRRRTTATCSSAQDVSSEDDVVFIERYRLKVVISSEKRSWFFHIWILIFGIFRCR